MIKFPLFAALVGIGAASPPSYDEGSHAARNIPTEVLLGIGAPVCRSPVGDTASRKLFFKVAAVTNELKPFGQLPETVAAEEAEDTATKGQPLWDNLGTLSYQITTSKPMAQRYFDQGLRLAYGFNHDEAGQSFRTAQKIDPDCAMCYWGEALVLGPNINMPMSQDAIAPAVRASEKAMSLRKAATSREQGLIEALSARYSTDGSADRKTQDGHYADAMRKLVTRYPDDQEIGVLYAEALMNLSPWDYWEAGGTKPKGKTDELVATIERVLKANPDHPGAIHYYIHTVEASSDPKRAEAYAERLGALMPGAGHLVHMPSHIYYRVGRYKDSLAANKQAVAIDEAYIADRKPAGIYPLAYYPHNVHFALVSAQMAGDGTTVLEAAGKLSALVSDQAAREFPIAQPVRVAPYFAHAQFSEPDSILALPAPASDLPYVSGLWHYARGVAFAEKGDEASAQKEVDAINRLHQSGDFTSLVEAGIPAPDVLGIARDVVLARIAQSKGDFTSAAAHFEKAAEVEDRLAYMEPAYWYYPIRQSLGAALLQKGDLDGAEKAFRGSLARVPNNGWSLYGLAEVYKKKGDAQLAAATQQLLDNAWAGRRDQLLIEKL